MKRKETCPSVDLFAEQRLREALSQFSLVELRLLDLIPWEIFREKLSVVRADYSRGGRPPYDEILMFKCLILQALYNLSDEALEIEIYNRTSFRVFLGMNIASDVPDRNTIWKFRDRLDSHGLTKLLFDEFTSLLTKKGLVVKKGSIVDATFVEAPKQRNTPEENKAIKSGKNRDEVFKERSFRSRSQKDTDARWASKNREQHFGYKNHIRATADKKFIIDYLVTSASVYDGKVFLDLLPEQAETDQSVVYADSAYGSADNIAQLRERGYTPKINAKGSRFKKLTAAQIKNNNLLSKTRCRIEHIFADMTIRANGLIVRTIGLSRARVKIGLMNLAYNMRRYLTLIS